MKCTKKGLRDIRKKVFVRNNNSEFYRDINGEKKKKTRIISKIEYGNIKRNTSTEIVHKSENVWKIREGNGIVINTCIFLKKMRHSPKITNQKEHDKNIELRGSPCNTKAK